MKHKDMKIVTLHLLQEEQDVICQEKRLNQEYQIKITIHLVMIILYQIRHQNNQSMI